MSQEGWHSSKNALFQVTLEKLRVMDRGYTPCPMFTLVLLKHVQEICFLVSDSED